MPGFLMRVIIVAAGLWLAELMVAGIQFDGPGTLLAAALLLGIVNAVIRPIAILLTLPFTILSLGLFLLVINAAMLGLVSALLGGFALAGFWSAIAGGIVVSLTGWLASWYIGPGGRVEVLVVRDD
ncbi:MAG: phage holin family protein [Myxococcota bacterium]|nr:phage holin family protein [Myxococcota bacterium]